MGTGFLLGDLYSRALDTSLTETLQFHLESLAGETLSAGDPAAETVAVADPRFDRPRSGWYWTIRDEAGILYNLSTSVVGIALPEIPEAFGPQGVRMGVLEDEFGTLLRMIEREVTIAGQRYRIVVTGSLSETYVLAGEFRGQALIVLVVVGAMLAIMSAIVARFALRPIGRLVEAVERVREGESAEVAGTFPREIAPLAAEVNELLRSNTQIIERARSQVGNLAHGLKTPIAVLRNEAEAATPGLAGVVTAEVDKMAQIVSTYLDRARLSARTSVVGKKADPAAVIERLVRVMKKLHPARDIAILSPVGGPVPWFRGEEGDLEEMVGNLLDNAAKWAGSTVRVEMAEAWQEGNRLLVIVIGDDGRGLSEAEAEAVLKRGVRLDEKTPGSGLGLDIVKELVDVYGGRIAFGRSRLGGLGVTLTLPAARPGRGQP